VVLLEQAGHGHAVFGLALVVAAGCEEHLLTLCGLQVLHFTFESTLCICSFFFGQPGVARAQNPAPVPPAVLAPDVPQVAQGDQWVPALVLLNTPATSAEALDAAKADLLADVGVVGQLQDVADHPLLPVLQLNIKGTDQLMRLANEGRVLALQPLQTDSSGATPAQQPKGWLARPWACRWRAAPPQARARVRCQRVRWAARPVQAWRQAWVAQEPKLTPLCSSHSKPWWAAWVWSPTWPRCLRVPATRWCSPPMAACGRGVLTFLDNWALAAR
jgi:hypothetical protein